VVGCVVGHPPNRFALYVGLKRACFNLATRFGLRSSRGIQWYNPCLNPTPDREDTIQSVRAAFLGQPARWVAQVPSPPPVPPLSLALLLPMACVAVGWAQRNAQAERAGWSSLQAAWAAHPFQSAGAHAAPLTPPACAANMQVGSPVNDISGERGAPCWMHTRQRKLCSGWVHWRQPDHAAAVCNLILMRGDAAHRDARCTLLLSQPSRAAGSGCTMQPGMQASWHASSSSRSVVPDMQTSLGWGGVFRGAMRHTQNPTFHLNLSSPAASMLACRCHQVLQSAAPSACGGGVGGPMRVLAALGCEVELEPN
jgi:hypothetical protein